MNNTLQLGDIEADATEPADLCRRYHVRELSVFGSAARGEMRPDSDIDFLVEFMPEAKVDLIDHAGLMLDLSQFLGRRVDLVSKRGLKPLIRDSILRRGAPRVCGVRILYLTDIVEGILNFDYMGICSLRKEATSA